LADSGANTGDIDSRMLRRSADITA
jgi:hypothetical protein